MAVCRIRVSQPALYGKQAKRPSYNEVLPAQNDRDGNSSKIRETDPLLSRSDFSAAPADLRLKWATAISEKVFDRENLDDDSGVRDWDLVLNVDGTIENHAGATTNSSPSAKHYPTRYQIPSAILDRLDNDQEKARRAEVFALGGLLYETYSGTQLRGDPAKGEFPEDVWEMPHAIRILSCWCPKFAQDLLAAHRENCRFHSCLIVVPIIVTSFLL